MTTQATLSDRFAAAKRGLEAVGQAHVLTYYDKLDDAGRAELLAQVESVDWPEVAGLVESHVKRKPAFALPENLQPAPWYANKPPAELRDKYSRALELGRDLVRRGKAAAFTVAGGQGTRLGWAGPKGTFPASPIRGQSLFGCMAEYILKTQAKYKCVIPWYIMTSPVNDRQTRDYFQRHNHLGLDPRNVMLFPQAMMPAIDAADRPGKVLLESPGSLALSPNGHGGSLKALFASGAIADMKSRGVEQVSYTQVDNPIVKVIDPQFLGLHALDDCQMSSKMLPKAYPKEKLGNFCLVGGKMTVIEYSDLPDDLAHQRAADGRLRFLAGSIAIHAIRVDFIERLNRKGFGLPFHRAEKKVPCLDLATGRPVNPDKPNAVKLETFVFDALPLCERSIIYETDRVDEFAPIKNADSTTAEPSVDSPETSRWMQTERAARWLESRGVKVVRDAQGRVDALIEVSQLTAVEPADLQGVKLPVEIKAGERVLL